jgi:hypothetical protein
MGSTSSWCNSGSNDLSEVVDDKSGTDAPNEPPKEATKLCFETNKQIALLASGAIVLIGSFSKDIFPISELGLGSKLLLAGALIFLGASLAIAAYAMDWNVQIMVDIEEGKRSESYLRLRDKLKGTAKWSSRVFVLGLICFALVALINLF